MKRFILQQASRRGCGGLSLSTSISSRLTNTSSLGGVSTSQQRSFSTVHVHGATGRLGSEIAREAETEVLAHRSTEPVPSQDIDVIVDVSLPEPLANLIDRLLAGIISIIYIHSFLLLLCLYTS